MMKILYTYYRSSAEEALNAASDKDFKRQNIVNAKLS